jgi:MFS family permease
MITHMVSFVDRPGTAPAQPLGQRGGPLLVMVTGATALGVAVGIGRFAFTPLLPMMLQDGVIDLVHGSWLATANYLGYLLGALACMVLPRHWRSAMLIRLGLVATLLLTLGMALPLPPLWLPLRFLAGAASAVVFVHAVGWSLARLAEMNAPEMGGAIFTGPGIGIALSGLAAMGMVAAGSSAAMSWLAFGLLCAALSLLVWPAYAEPGRAAPAVAGPGAAKPPAARAAAVGCGPVELAIFTLAYGLAGFGYIITATFLPVIARQALAGSLWLDLFWPILGCGAVIGSLLATRWPVRFDPRLALALGYAAQALGVVFPLLVPTTTGFAIASLLVGLPFTAISFFAMQEARRLRPQDAARCMGLLTGVYGLGQIAGPPLTGILLAGTGDPGRGFALALATASASLVVGAGLCLLLRRRWPVAA